MWDFILLLLERSKNSQWVSHPHSCLFAATVEASSCVDMLASPLSVSCRTRTSWSHCSTRCTSTPQLRFPPQWRYHARVPKKYIISRSSVFLDLRITIKTTINIMQYPPTSKLVFKLCLLCHAGVSGSHTREDVPGGGLLLGHHSYCRRLCPLQIWQTC